MKIVIFGLEIEQALLSWKPDRYKCQVSERNKEKNCHVERNLYKQKRSALVSVTQCSRGHDQFFPGRFLTHSTQCCTSTNKAYLWQNFYDDEYVGGVPLAHLLKKIFLRSWQHNFLYCKAKIMHFKIMHFATLTTELKLKSVFNLYWPNNSL